MVRVQASMHPRKSTLAVWLSYMAASLVVAMVVLQLFTYESMAAALGELLPAAFPISATVVAAIIVILEVFSLPYLLPISLSRLAWLCALAMSWLVPLVWLAVMFMALGTRESAISVPLLGTKLGLDLGLVPVCLMLFQLSLVATLSTMDYQSRRG